MKKIFINADDEDFVVHIEQNQAYANWINGRVYPIQRYEYVKTGKKDWGYVLLQDGTSTDSHEPNDDCRVMFDFSFCWRGVWEGRIYFKDDEYWSEELNTINEAWKKILPVLKSIIKHIDPGNHYDD